MSDNGFALKLATDAIGKGAGAIKGKLDSFADKLDAAAKQKQQGEQDGVVAAGAKASSFEEGHKGAGSGQGEHYGFIERMAGTLHAQDMEIMASQQAHEVTMARESGKQTRATLRTTAKFAGDSKPGTKKTVQAGADGSLAISHTTAPAPRGAKPAAASAKPAGKTSMANAPKPKTPVQKTDAAKTSMPKPEAVTPATKKVTTKKAATAKTAVAAKAVRGGRK
jgi:hypothetical protein